MLATTISAVILSLVSRLLPGCSPCHHYGYGRVIASRLDAASVQPLELSANVAPTSSRFCPRLTWTW